MRETELYPPLKAFLEAQGYAVKGEVDGCDIAAVRGDEPPLIVEMKTRFSLSLVLQGIARQAVSDRVYLAAPPFSGRKPRQREAIALCRRLGLGLLAVQPGPEPQVEALLDPAPYRPRLRKRAAERLLREFRHRVGDPNAGGSTRRKLMTAYRQDALRCAAFLQWNGPTKAAAVARAADVPRARAIMYADHYGWFERPGSAPRGIYALTPKGADALRDHADVLALLAREGGREPGR